MLLVDELAGGVLDAGHVGLAVVVGIDREDRIAVGEMDVGFVVAGAVGVAGLGVGVAVDHDRHGAGRAGRVRASRVGAGSGRALVGAARAVIAVAALAAAVGAAVVAVTGAVVGA